MRMRSLDSICLSLAIQMELDHPSGIHLLVLVEPDVRA
jgi:hypothetical protein